MNQLLTAFLTSLHHQTIVDLATGIGQWIDWVSESISEDNTIVGVDTNRNAVERAKAHFQNQKHIQFRQADAYSLPFEDQSIDVVMCSNSLHHFEHHAQLFREINRVLKPKGFFLVAEMVADRLTRAQISHKKLHHFASEIDSLRGDFHGYTYAKNDLLAIVEQQLQYRCVWHFLMGTKPVVVREETAIQGLIETSKQLLKRIPNTTQTSPWVKKQKHFEEYLQKYGFSSASSVIALYQKP